LSGYSTRTVTENLKLKRTDEDIFANRLAEYLHIIDVTLLMRDDFARANSNKSSRLSLWYARVNELCNIRLQALGGEHDYTISTDRSGSKTVRLKINL
jgi:hypothetical protein